MALKLSVLVLLICLICSSRQGTKKSVCKKINNFENGLPENLKRIDSDDYLGAAMTAWHQPFVNSLKYWPDYFKPEMCKSHLMKIGDVLIKLSLRPRGCCTNCCLIDNVEKYLTFLMHSKNDSMKALRLGAKRKPGTLAKLGFNKDAKTIIHFHGFSEDGFVSRSAKALADAYFKKKEPYNVLNLDYSELSLIPWYHEAVDNVKMIVQAAAKFIIFYHETGELRIENIHAMGISLGGQVASHFAKEIGKYKKIWRLTGLDPAFALYDDEDPIESISKNDAEFVDVIHTISGFFGDRVPVGHADFFISYPPGTAIRPACDFIKLLERGEFADYFLCDHLRAIRMYVQTIANPHLFPVCKNITDNLNSTQEICGYLGLAANKSTTIGKYSLSTKLDWDAWKELDAID